MIVFILYLHICSTQNMTRAPVTFCSDRQDVRVFASQAACDKAGSEATDRVRDAVVEAVKGYECKTLTVAQ